MKYLLHLQTDEEKTKLMEQEEYKGITFIKFLCSLYDLVALNKQQYFSSIMVVIIVV
jgi:hypothetical protein